MFIWIDDAEYNLSSRDVVDLLNGEFRSTFDKEVTTLDVNRWTKNNEINAIKGEGTRWRYREGDILDFVYRFQHGMLHKFNSSYYDRTSCRVPDDILRDWFHEESTFQHIVCILVTLHPYALFNDPDRYYSDIRRAEGGIIFKNAAVSFHTLGVGIKDTALALEKQRLLYPVLVAQAINQLTSAYMETEGGSIKERLLAAGWELVNNQIPYDQYLQEAGKGYGFGGWSGLNYHLHEEIRPTYFVPMAKRPR